MEWKNGKGGGECFTHPSFFCELFYPLNGEKVRVIIIVFYTILVKLKIRTQ